MLLSGHGLERNRSVAMTAAGIVKEDMYLLHEEDCYTGEMECKKSIQHAMWKTIEVFCAQ